MSRKVPLTPPTEATSPGARVRWLRRSVSDCGRKKLWDQAHLAGLAGVSRRTVVLMEQDSYEVTARQWEAVVRALGVTMELLHMPLRQWVAAVKRLKCPATGFTGEEAARWAGPQMHRSV